MSISFRSRQDFGDLYMSIADYSSFEAIDFEHTFYLDLLFRRDIYVEESVFFIKELPFADFALKKKGHIHAALKEGIIIPLTKDTKVDSFGEIACRYPHIRLNDATLRPETLYEDMLEIARLYDRSYTKNSRLNTRAISLEEARYYNQDLQTILKQEAPPTEEDGTASMEWWRDVWRHTEQFRTEWVAQVVQDAESRGLASAPKTAFNRLGAELFGIDYQHLRQLILYAPNHPKGKYVIAFLRWVHEIFYYSRSRAISAATTYALKSGHIPLPLALRGDGASTEHQFVECSIRLPKIHAMSSMNSRKFLELRETEEAEGFFEALRSWQMTGRSGDRSDVEAALVGYTEVISKEAAKSSQSALVKQLVRVDNGSIKKLSSALTVLGAATTFVAPLASPSIGMASAGMTLASSAVTAISFMNEKATFLRATQKATARIYEDAILDVNSEDGLISF